ncbi:MAG: response regulator [Thermoleophilia bacterium]|nr:response regulator [Thermoleophilia bacterium]
MDLPKGSGQKILLVDDDVNHIVLLKKRLEASGYMALVAHDGVDGLNQAIHQRPDLIITDVLLPKLNGFQLVEQLKANPETNTIPIIMMSAVYVTDEDMAKGFDLGAETYVAKADLALRKPLQEEVLLEATAALLNIEPGEKKVLPERILIVDDDPAAVRIITKKLEAEGYLLDVAHDGREALEKALALPVDLILLDIQLPEIDGLSVLSRVKESRPEIAVIMMTAFGSEQVAVEALKRGADDYLIKPLEQDEPVPAIRQCLDKKRRRRQVEQAAGPLRQAATPDMEEKQRLIEELRQSSITLMDQYNRLLAAEEQNRAYAERLEQMVDERTQDLQRRTRELGALHTVLSAATRSLDLPEVLVVALGELEQILGTSAAAAFIVDQETSRLRLVAQHEMPADFLRQISREPGGDGIFAKVLESGKGIVIQDPSSRKELSSVGKDAVRLVVFPMKSVTDIVGLIVGVSADKNEIDESGWRLLDSIGEEMGVVVENVRLYESLRQAYLSTIRALAEAVDAKDAHTRGHSDKVSAFAVAIARKMGLDNDFIESIRDAGYLHDIGKIGTPDAVLTKQGVLTPEEMDTMRLHPGASHKILAPARLPEDIKQMIWHHHERYNGSGYPDGLKHEEIPLGSRILAVADAYEAMTADRPYRQSLTTDEAVAELRRCSGEQFDATIVEAFLEIRVEAESAVREEVGQGSLIDKDSPAA